MKSMNKKGSSKLKQMASKNVNTNLPKKPSSSLMTPGKMSIAPVARAKVVKTGGPKYKYLSNGDIVIHHREYIADISANSGTPSTFQATTFNINPGQSSTFPWLSSVASRFESYSFEALHFLFETEAPSSLGGSLILSVDYDSTDLAPLTKQQAMSYRNAVRSAPWEPCCHTSLLEDLKKLPTFYVRPAGIPSGTDVKTYDAGNLFVCTQNVTTASAVCGELYVEYIVRLMTPVTEPNATASGTYFSNSGMSNTTQFITGATTSGGLVISVLSGTEISISGFVNGAEYILAQDVVGTVVSPMAYTIGSTGTSVTSRNVVNSATTQGIIFNTFTAQSNTITFTSNSTFTTLTSNMLYVGQTGGSPGF